MKRLAVFIAYLLFLVACGGSGFSDSGTGDSSSTIALYFTDPDDPAAGRFKNGPEEFLLTAISQANTSIDIAIYELSLANITQALIDAHKRNVQVRVLTDTDHLHWDSITDLLAAGVTVRGDERSYLMHNKFTVIDNKEVWTGSMNLTYFGAYRHNENLIQIKDSQAALNYSEEFLQLWNGTHNQANAANNYFMVGSVPVDVHFSPDDNFRETRLLPLLRQATQSVHLMAFAFTSEDIANELVNLKRSGVEVKIVLDKGLAGQSSSQYDELLALQMDILRDGNPYKLHHKVIIIDGRYVVTGSYNFSQSAESRNDENSVVIDSPAIARQFETEFRKVYQQGLDANTKESYTSRPYSEGDSLY